MHGGGRYRRLLRQPRTAAVLGPYLLARVSAAMVLLALLLHVQDATGSFAKAGLASACFAVAVAVASPLLGRTADRRGQTGVLLVLGSLHPLALLVVVLAGSSGRLAVLLPATVVAGATMPPMAACMRALWPSLTPDPSLRTTAFAVEAIVVESCELGGPLLVAALASVLAPAAALTAAAVLSGVGTLLFALSRASRDRVCTRTSHDRFGSPLRSRPVRLLVLLVALTTASLALTEIAVVRYAADHGGGGRAGWFLGFLVAGSLVGGWLYGSREWIDPLPRQLTTLLLALGLLLMAPLLATGPVSFALLLLVAGWCIAPVTAVQFALLSDLCPDQRRTEAFTWASTAAFLGIAAGSLSGGWLVERSGVAGGLLLAAGIAVAAGLSALRGRAMLVVDVPAAVTDADADGAGAGAGVGAGAGAGGAAAIAPRDVSPTIVALVERLQAERDRALECVRATGARNDDLARELARLRQEGRGTTAQVDVSADVFVLRRLERLEEALRDLRALEGRRAAALDLVEQLRLELQGNVDEAHAAGVGDHADGARVVTSLPRQAPGA